MKYLNFGDNPLTTNYGVGGVKTALANLNYTLSAFTVEFIARFADEFTSNKSALLFQCGNIECEFDISKIDPQHNTSIPRFVFGGAVGNGILDMTIELDGIDRKSLSYYIDNDYLNNGWHHFVFIIKPVDNGFLQQQIFIDGMSPDGFSKVSNVTGLFPLSDLFFNFGTNSTEDFLGDFDELAVYDRDLTEGEVYQHYLDFKNHSHYHSASALPPLSLNVNGELDPLEFPNGYILGTEDYTSATPSLSQITSYPIPRFIPLHNLRKNVTYVKASHMADIYGTSNYLPLKLANAVGIQNELAENWNYYYNFTENTSAYFDNLDDPDKQVNAAYIKDINTSGKNYRLAALTYRKQQNITNAPNPPCTFNGCSNFDLSKDEGCVIANQQLEATSSSTTLCQPYALGTLYPKIGSNSGTGTKITPGQNKPKSWSPLCILPSDPHRLMYAQDAFGLEYNLDRFLNSAPNHLNTLAKSRIDLLIENNEIAPKYDGTLGHNLMADNEINLAVTTSGLTIADFESKAKMNIDNDYRDYILGSLGLPTNTALLNYAVDGHENPRYIYKYLRETQSTIGGKKYPTPDLYIVAPKYWHVDGASDKHGWRWLAEAKKIELSGTDINNISYSDKRIAPFVSPGYNQRSEIDTRPGQYLGFLKAVMLQGTDFFFAYSEPNTPIQNRAGSSFCWKIAPPVYAQAIGSRLEHFLTNGVSLHGDMPLNPNTPAILDPSYWFKSEDLQNLITVRQDYNGTTPLNRFAIVGAKMKYSNSLGCSPILDNATFNLPLNGTGSTNQTLKIPIRRQGSTYIYDYTNTGNIIFYQLDKWHQFEHPEHWIKDFEFEAEVNDNTVATSDWLIKSENIITTPTEIDLTNVTSFIHFNAIPSSANPLVYNFQPRHDGSVKDYALWIRARTTSVSTGISITLNSTLGTITHPLNNITASTWTWYEVTPGINTYTSLVDNDIHYQLQLLPLNTSVEIDAIKLTTNQCPGTIVIQSGLAASGIPVNNYTGATISLKGSFIVDHDFTFNNCTVNASSGAIITIMPGNTLTINNSSSFGTCYQMWRGIVVQDGATLVIDNSTISDAQYAVKVDDGGIVNTRNNTSLNNNYIGIYSTRSADPHGAKGITLLIDQTRFETLSNLKPGYPGQTYLTGPTIPVAKCYAGVYLVNSGLFEINGITGTNVFSNLYNGIVSFNSSPSISNCRFENIASLGFNSIIQAEGSAIYSVGAEYYNLNQSGLGDNVSSTPTFNNCTFGIYSDIGSTIINNYFTQITNTAISCYGGVLRTIGISHNLIESNHNGIVLNQNDGAFSVNVNTNNIYIGQNIATAGTNNAGIIFSNIEKGGISNAIISNNYVSLFNNYYAGIHVMNAGFAAVTQNHVEQFNSSTPGVINSAIKIENCDRNSINCNSINDDAAITSLDPAKVAIEINNSPGNMIGCNSTNQTGDGFYFHMNCDNTIFTGNNLHNHDVGLHVASNSVIGKQPSSATANNRANEWLGSYSQWGAWNENTPLIQSSEFKYDQTNNSGNSNPFLYPGTVNPVSGWFNPFPNLEDECMTTVHCEALRLGCEGESLTSFDYQVAEHFIALSTEWPNETRWIAERSLYNKLLRCPLLMEHELMVNFFNQFSEYDSRRLFSEIEHQLNNSMEYNSVNDSVQASCDSLSLLFIAQIDSINLLISDAISNGNKPLYFSLLSIIRSVQQQQQQIILIQQELANAINEQRQLTAVELMQDNLASTFTLQYEINQQQFNDIHLSGIVSGNRSVDYGQIATLNSIANQCPYSGGPAVYQARAKLIAVQGSRQYDDRQICYQNNLAWRHAESAEHNIQLKIQPNPGSDYIKINYRFEEESLGQLLITNTLGILLYSVKLDNNSGQQNYDTSKLANGVYFISIISEGGKSSQEKLIINK